MKLRSQECGFLDFLKRIPPDKFRFDGGLVNNQANQSRQTLPYTVDFVYFGQDESLPVLENMEVDEAGAFAKKKMGEDRKAHAKSKADNQANQSRRTLPYTIDFVFCSQGESLPVLKNIEVDEASTFSKNSRGENRKAHAKTDNPSTSKNSKQMSRGLKRRHHSSDSMDQDELRLRFGALMEKSRVPETNGVMAVSSNKELLDIPMPSFEQFSAISAKRLLRNTIEDLRLGDIVCAKVIKVSFTLLELQPVCMLARFRRIFPDFEVQKVPYDSACRKYAKNDYVQATVESLDQEKLRFTIKINEDETTLHLNDLPLYYRQTLDGKSRDLDIRKNEQMQACLQNNNLPELVDISIESARHSFLPQFRNKKWMEDENEAQDIRSLQNHELAMTHVVKGTKLMKEERKFFEAIQCFTHALNIDDTCVEAYTARGAACANEANYKGALNDLNRALELYPHYKNAIRYKSDVLTAYGLRYERESEFDKAKKCHEEAVELAQQIGHENRAKANLESLNRQMNKKHDVITIEDEKSKPKKEKRMSSEDRKKLQDYERLISELKKKK